MYQANVSASDLKLTMAVLHIYFATMQSETISNVPAYDFMALLSDIGGALGLLLGATLLTVFEVTEFALNLIHDVINMRRDPVIGSKANSDTVSGKVKVVEVSSAIDS
jgi:hypothetical protein